MLDKTFPILVFLRFEHLADQFAVVGDVRHLVWVHHLCLYIHHRQVFLHFDQADHIGQLIHDLTIFAGSCLNGNRVSMVLKMH